MLDRAPAPLSQQAMPPKADAPSTSVVDDECRLHARVFPFTKVVTVHATNIRGFPGGTVALSTLVFEYPRKRNSLLLMESAPTILNLGPKQQQLLSFEYSRPAKEHSLFFFCKINLFIYCYSYTFQLRKPLISMLTVQQKLQHFSRTLITILTEI